MNDNREILLDCFPDDRYGEQYIFPTKGTTEAGYVWAPYVPVFDGIQTVDDETAKNLEKYYEKPINKSFYGTLNLSGTCCFTGITGTVA